MPGPSCPVPLFEPSTGGLAVVAATTKVAVGAAVGVALGKGERVGVAGTSGSAVGALTSGGIATSVGTARNLKRTSPPMPSNPRKSDAVSTRAITINSLLLLIPVPLSILSLHLLSCIVCRLPPPRESRLDPPMLMPLHCEKPLVAAEILEEFFNHIWFHPVCHQSRISFCRFFEALL